MARDEDPDRPAPKPKHSLGEPLDTLSAEELRSRIDLLRSEILRLEAEVGAKEASRSAADAFFKR
jgi:uncharacterized small protein (DUF1192 family)